MFLRIASISANTSPDLVTFVTKVTDSTLQMTITSEANLVLLDKSTLTKIISDADTTSRPVKNTKITTESDSSFKLSAIPLMDKMKNYASNYWQGRNKNKENSTPKRNNRGEFTEFRKDISEVLGEYENSNNEYKELRKDISDALDGVSLDGDGDDNDYQQALPRKSFSNKKYRAQKNRYF